MKLKNKSKTSRNVIIVAIVTALAIIGDSMLYIALPIYWQEAGLDSIWQVGIILSINRFIRLPLNPIIGWFYQKVTLRTGLLLAVLLTIISTIGYGVSSSFIVWIILRCLWGLAWSLLRIGGLSTVVLFSNHGNRGKTMGVFNGIYRLGSLVGMLVGGILVPIIGLQSVAFIFGVIAILGLPLIVRNIAGNTDDLRQPNQIKIPKKAFLITLLSRNTLLVLTSGFFVTMLFQGILASTLSATIQFHYGSDIHLLGLIITVTALSGIIQAARWAWEPFLASRIGYWSDRMKNRITLYIFSLLFCAIMFGLMASNIPVVLWIFITLLVMFSATALTTLTDTLAINIAGSSSTVSFITLYTVIQDFGAAAGPTIAFLLISLHHGIKFIYIGGSIIFLILAFLWFIQWKSTSRNNRTLLVNN